MKDSGLPIGKAAAIAKLATSEVATRVSHQVKQHQSPPNFYVRVIFTIVQAMQLMGHAGMVMGNGVERNYRDARLVAKLQWKP